MTEQNIGKILRKAREMQGMSQMQVATLAGISIGQYQRLEYGVRDLHDEWVSRDLPRDHFLLHILDKHDRPSKQHIRQFRC